MESPLPNARCSPADLVVVGVQQVGNSAGVAGRALSQRERTPSCCGPGASARERCHSVERAAAFDPRPVCRPLGSGGNVAQASIPAWLICTLIAMRHPNVERDGRATRDGNAHACPPRCSPRHRAPRCSPCQPVRRWSTGGVLSLQSSRRTGRLTSAHGRKADYGRRTQLLRGTYRFGGVINETSLSCGRGRPHWRGDARSDSHGGGCAGDVQGRRRSPVLPRR